MADDEKRYEQMAINNDAWKKHRRSPVTFEGRLGIDVNGTMTEEGWEKFLDDMKAEGIRLARIDG